jgi:hypothetical protein
VQLKKQGRLIPAPNLDAQRRGASRTAQHPRPCGHAAAAPGNQDIPPDAGLPKIKQPTLLASK